MGGSREDGQLSLQKPGRTSRHFGLGSLAALVLLLAPGGCGSGFNRASAIESFRTANEEATPGQAECVVDALIDTYGVDQLESELGADPIDAGFEEAQFREMFRCGVAGDWRQQITDQLIENGVAPDDAPCVSDELFATMTDDDVDVLLSGEITDSFTDLFYTALESCDALNQ